MFPYLLQTGNFSVTTYGLFLALAFILGTQYAIIRARRKGIEKKTIIRLAVIYLLTG
ncbi:prolipoprotein diacylglyceryl transferase family protein, partial [Fibrobacterota bacterium]